MARGRPALRIGQHGRITRTQLAPGKWEARCRVRDADGVLRHVARQSPMGTRDRLGGAAEAALLGHLSTRAAHVDDGTITSSTLISALLERHLDALKAAERAPRTLYSYTLRVGYWNTVAAGITVTDCTPGRLDRLLAQVRAAHGDTDAKQLRTLVAAALDMAVNEGVLVANPARATKPAPQKRASKGGGAQPIDPAALPAVVKALLESESCQARDLTDPILMHLATGLRVSEVLGLLWSEFDTDAKTLGVSGRVVRDIGVGLLRTPTVDSSKGTAPTLALPQFAVELLLARATVERPNKLGLIFPSSVGTLRDPNNFAKQWRNTRDGLTHLSGTTGHSFRKTMSNLVTDHTSDPRVAADVLGHSDMQTTMRHYLQRGKVHPEVAAAVDKAINAD
ncbi:tyrosine-type recombinase/integrase [Mycobacteroides abscessus]|nr:MULTISPECIES: tyrosine-type recombinase/integrase [Mycobacteroides]MBN7310347.1 tyrosine-type recombinase/integrase [Mycobacteroides abscessus subsp. abscessus]MBN7460694.1 tyrosine-type recombinase/integrase [Mycobacteroides abscessus subsp. abscessus]MBN7557520.1 tyrosine-type recombinase/integrase [Mycobacteroides abscessus subsp. abscessus]MDM2407473.1 tyrosine-type recombinase/integrase [Mycobacteroides abscessus]MDM2414938.1 tyrosine-type recombinase/integrase [Mycobacteroides abscess